MSGDSNFSTYDGVLSLGAWCQVGAAIWRKDLCYIHSPIHNFGIKRWQFLIDILESRFLNYWEQENMSLGKIVVGFSNKYKDTRPIYKAYCNKYKMISNHHFDEVDNAPETLNTYELFKEKIDLLSEIFLIQCESYERVLFALKILSHDEPTTICKEDITRLCAVLNDLRKGRPYNLRISVPEDLYDDVLLLVRGEQLTHISIYPWTIKWNDDITDAEWKWMLGDVKLTDDHYHKLNIEIIGLSEISPKHLEYLNS